MPLISLRRLCPPRQPGIAGASPQSMFIGELLQHEE